MLSFVWLNALRLGVWFELALGIAVRWLTLFFIGLIAGLQYAFWLGKGGWLKAQDLQRQVEQHKARNAKLVARNAALDAEVSDLKQGFEAIEERARNELGLVKPQEIWFHFVEEAAKPPEDHSAKPHP